MLYPKKLRGVRNWLDISFFLIISPPLRNRFHICLSLHRNKGKKQGFYQHFMGINPDVIPLYKISASEEVIGAKRKKEKKQLDKLDFVYIIDLCVNHKIVTKQFSKELHKVRKLRNKLHLGGLEEVEKEYTKEDLNFVFKVAEKAKSIVSS